MTNLWLKQILYIERFQSSSNVWKHVIKSTSMDDNVWWFIEFVQLFTIIMSIADSENMNQIFLFCFFFIFKQQRKIFLFWLFVCDQLFQRFHHDQTNLLISSSLNQDSHTQDLHSKNNNNNLKYTFNENGQKKVNFHSHHHHHC